MIKDNLLIAFLLLGVTIGVILGIYLRDVWTFEDYRKIFYLEFPGRILMNMLKSLVLPLIITSLVSAIATLGAEASGKLGAAAILYYLSTTLIAVIIGIILVLVIHPGQSVTQIVKVKSQPRKNETGNNTYTVDLDKPRLVKQAGTNTLGVVLASIVLGCVINIVGEDGKPLKAFFDSLNCATMILIKVVIWYSPIGIIFLVSAKFISTKDILVVITSLAMYMLVILSGLAIHGLIVLPIIYYALTRKNPARFGSNMMKALFTAWGTSSSSATLPITMDCLIQKNELDINIVRFVAPVGATINMDGTALYEAVACIFIAQVNDMSLSMADVIIISLTATAAAIGAAGIPQAGIVTMVIVLTAVGLPIDDITLIVSVDWFLDRFRTVVNVWGDCVGAGILDHFFSANLSKSLTPYPTSEMTLQLSQDSPILKEEQDHIEKADINLREANREEVSETANINTFLTRGGSTQL